MSNLGVVAFSTPRLQTFWRYAKVEFKPPTPSEIPDLAKRFGDVVTSASTGKWQKLSVKEALANTLVCAELAILFFVGEVVGRGSLIGYDVSRVQPHFPFFWNWEQTFSLSYL